MRLRIFPGFRIVVMIAAALLVIGGIVAPAANAAPADDACSLLTQAQVSAASPVSVGAGTYVTPTFKRTCTWSTSGDDAKTVQSITLLVEAATAFDNGKRLGAAKNVVITPVSGVGDDAYYLAIGTQPGLIVKKGNVTFKVTVYAGALSVEKKEVIEKTLAVLVASKL
jgi:hypothetical protein